MNRITRGLVYLLCSVGVTMLLPQYPSPIPPPVIIDLIFIRMVVFAASIQIFLTLERPPKRGETAWLI